MPSASNQAVKNSAPGIFQDSHEALGTLLVAVVELQVLPHIARGWLRHHVPTTSQLPLEHIVDDALKFLLHRPVDLPALVGPRDRPRQRDAPVHLVGPPKLKS